MPRISILIAQYELDFDLRVQFRQFGHVVMSIDLLFVDNTTTHRLFGDRARVDLLLHGSHGQQAIYVANLFLSQAKHAENVLFWKIQQKQMQKISKFSILFHSVRHTHDHWTDSKMCLAV